MIPKSGYRFSDKIMQRETAPERQEMNELAKTDKVLSRKEAGVGYVVFNNPERHNAMSLDMWAATGKNSLVHDPEKWVPVFG